MLKSTLNIFLWDLWERILTLWTQESKQHYEHSSNGFRIYLQVLSTVKRNKMEAELRGTRMRVA